MLQEGMLYTLGERGDVSRHSPSSSRTVRDPHNVHASDATGFPPPDPRHLQFAGVRLYTLVFGLKQRCLGWLYTLAFGSTCQCWFIDAGIGLYTLDAEGCARFRTLLFMTGAQAMLGFLIPWSAVKRRYGRGHTLQDVGSVSWVGVVRVVPILSADMGYARQGLQGREWGWRMGAGLGHC